MDLSEKKDEAPMEGFVELLDRDALVDDPDRIVQYRAVALAEGWKKAQRPRCSGLGNGSPTIPKSPTNYKDGLRVTWQNLGQWAGSSEVEDGGRSSNRIRMFWVRKK